VTELYWQDWGGTSSRALLPPGRRRCALLGFAVLLVRAGDRNRFTATIGDYIVCSDDVLREIATQSTPSPCSLMGLIKLGVSTKQEESTFEFLDLKSCVDTM
jgi:hypothetical protein